MGKYEHILLPEVCQLSFKYTTKKKARIEHKIPLRKRMEHAAYLEQKFDDARASAAAIKEKRTAVSLPTYPGIYLEFAGAENFELMYRSLESKRAGIKLLNVRENVKENDALETVATVYIPRDAIYYFLKKIEEYKNPLKDSKKKVPRNANLLNSIEDINVAVLSSFWTDANNKFPTDRNEWYEIWIETDNVADNSTSIKRFTDILSSIKRIEYKQDFLLFPERAVFLVYANLDDLIEIMYQTEHLAEIKRGQDTAGFLIHENNWNLEEWINDILGRLNIVNETDVSVCVLDTGVNNGHPLLAPFLKDDHCLTCNSEWGTADHNKHGTLMAGVVAYGDLTKIVTSEDDIPIYHSLCSVKILPNSGENRKELWGAITQDAVSRAEISLYSNLPRSNKKIIYCMAVTADCDDNGKPSSWSGAVDNICYGEGKSSKLVILSAGNIENDPEAWSKYPLSNNMSSIQSPAQSWNALTVGAYTEKIRVNDSRFKDYDIVAPSGGLSPYSRTSAAWNRKWPIKPDIVFEGGNLLKDRNLIPSFSAHEELEVLTTARNYQFRQFDTINATSAASAQAANIAAKIAYKYPDFWPESIRGLMVHSARWTETMFAQYNVNKRKNISNLLRACGHGVPDINRALFSSENGFTFISQNYIKPYKKSVGQSSVSTNEMHLFELPWPKEILNSLGGVELTLKVTISYFIEPGPGEIGWTDKYRYPSFGLRFDVNNPNEDKNQFKQRINKIIQDDEISEDLVDNDNARWKIGVNSRNKGSIQCDMIIDTGTALAECYMIAVFPIGGWWKTRTNLNKYNNKARYSLIVSLDTPKQDINLYADVKTKVQNLIRVPIEVLV